MTTESMTTLDAPAKSRRWRKFIAALVISGVCGAGVGNAIGRYLKHSHQLTHVNGWDIVALTLTAFYVGVALLLVWVSNHRMRLARLLEGDGAEVSANDEEVRSVRYQAIVMTLAGILLALPILGVRLSSGSLTRSEIVLACIVALFAVQTVFNVLLWRVSDEFVRGAMTATAACTFAIGQGGLFLWSAAERVHLVRHTSAWDLTIAMMLLYLVVGSVVSLRTMRHE